VSLLSHRWKCHTFSNGDKVSTRFEGAVGSQKLIWTFLVCLLFSISACAQSLPQSMPQRPGPPINSGRDDAGSDVQQQMAYDLAKKANEQRQKALVNDTDKLVKLAAELKDYVDKSNAAVLSVDVIKKADQIEKLAHSVKEKMKGPN
jgi:hypothetical protein